MKRTYSLCAAALFALSCGALLPASAQDAEVDFFKDKTVRLVVGFSAGGGYDLYARLIAPYLSNALGANIIIENQPGAAGMTSLRRIYTAQPDGLQMTLAAGTAASMAQLFADVDVRYDLTKVGFLALVSKSPYVWIVRKDSSLQSPRDAMNGTSKLAWSATGPLDGLSDGAAFTCEALKLNCQIIIGYKSTSDASLALIRGEVDTMYLSEPSANNYVKGGSARALATMSRTRSTFFPDLQTIFEAVDLTEEQKWWFDFRSTVDNLGRILITSPGVSEPRLKFMQRAAKEALTDPKLIAEGQKRQLLIDYGGPAETRTMAISVLASLTPEQKQLMKEVISKAK
jgi:tripartite-type tricarboxylate transporter receptor subunit TctC